MKWGIAWFRDRKGKPKRSERPVPPDTLFLEALDGNGRVVDCAVATGNLAAGAPLEAELAGGSIRLAFGKSDEDGRAS